MCIFDDINVISDKKIREAVYSILNQTLELGRHFKIHRIVTHHLPTNGKGHSANPQQGPYRHLLPAQRGGISSICWRNTEA